MRDAELCLIFVETDRPWGYEEEWIAVERGIPLSGYEKESFLSVYTHHSKPGAPQWPDG